MTSTGRFMRTRAGDSFESPPFHCKSLEELRRRQAFAGAGIYT